MAMAADELEQFNLQIIIFPFFSNQIKQGRVCIACEKNVFFNHAFS